VEGGALDSAVLIGNVNVRSESSGVDIHLGSGNYPGHRADKLFEVACTVVANPELVHGDPPLREPADLARHVLLHDDAMDIIAHGDSWAKWLEAAGVADRVDGTRGPRFSSNILSLEAASQKLGVALALKPLINADLASKRLAQPFSVELKPESAYYLVTPEVIAERPPVAAFRRWLLSQAGAA
jgi:LysR family glycine cleavage system transcriptional activator